MRNFQQDARRQKQRTLDAPADRGGFAQPGRRRYGLPKRPPRCSEELIDEFPVSLRKAQSHQLKMLTSGNDSVFAFSWVSCYNV